MKPRDRVLALRQQMEARGLAAYLVPSTDPHQSEYVPECWQRRAWLSGFSGSAGDVVVTRDTAGLWTDGRYFLQAGRELRGSGIKLFKLGHDGVPSIAEFLADHLEEGEAVGVDPRLVSPARERGLREALEPGGARIKSVDRNLVDAIWKGQPRRDAGPIRPLPRRFAGETVASKLRRLRRRMAEENVDAHVLTTLDSIAWLLNIRGRDVEFNPVVIAYALITPDAATLFVDLKKVDAATRRALGKRVQFAPYGDFASALRAQNAARARVWVDGDTASAWVVRLLSRCDLVTEMSPVVLMKARKNATEVQGMRDCHVRDGVAMVRFLRWLDDAVRREPVTEISAADRLEAYRSEGEHYQGLSFRTISGYADHGAIIHYSVTPQTDVPLKPRGIYLVDSGAQYLDGTTDITRTVLLGGRASREQRDHFTRVLKGHIALARVRFPAGVRGMRLDTLARLPLWEAGLDYNHGTGHGVGSYLNVHEGPQSISHGRCTGAELEPGNVQSNEPGYYREGHYGIRVESLILVEEDEAVSSATRTFYRFDTITMCPIDRRLIETSLLSSQERNWLDTYHARVKRTLWPHLDSASRKWLRAACAKL